MQRLSNRTVRVNERQYASEGKRGIAQENDKRSYNRIGSTQGAEKPQHKVGNIPLLMQLLSACAIMHTVGGLAIYKL